ncbi:GYF domain-containing protein [Stenotrophomonas sp. HITSZ_GD]|uniref:pilin n=1 Tax=Stenotrophomonas sp. HITSZ_GD TaxID=3037248 RepID=UPI00240DFC2E|nr:pilin [Stenotrophomonas sp. HITSZ_GD]MDG2525122.1 GYF domain-containing protein [Stenotrophomonas sp. HITSZ_GD]
MSEWYYAEGNRQRIGPLPDENLVELYRSGRIGLDTLVWREGLAQWRPLSDFADELALPAPADGHPPPLPFGAAAPGAAAAPPTPTPVAPRKGLSGCAIVAIVLAVVGVLSLAVIGILAAIAVPAYQEYVLRAKVSAGYADVAPLRAEVEQFHATEQRCPVNGEGNFGTPESYAQLQIGSVRIGRFDNGHCGVEAVFSVPGQAKLDGKALWLDLDPESGQWHCSSEIDDKYLPHECRG